MFLLYSKSSPLPVNTFCAIGTSMQFLNTLTQTYTSPEFFSFASSVAFLRRQKVPGIISRSALFHLNRLYGAACLSRLPSINIAYKSGRQVLWKRFFHLVKTSACSLLYRSSLLRRRHIFESFLVCLLHLSRRLHHEAQCGAKDMLTSVSH